MDKAVYDRLKPISERLKQTCQATAVILYGSYARGKATKHSDIDLLVIAPASERFIERHAHVLAVVRDLSRGLPLSPLVLTPAEVEARLKRGDPFLQEILETGVNL